MTSCQSEHEPFGFDQLITFNGFYVYQINFPPDSFISPSNIPQLEQLLPPREEVILPEEGEEVDLVKIDRDEQERSRRQHMVRTESHLDLSAFKIVGACTV